MIYPARPALVFPISQSTLMGQSNGSLNCFRKSSSSNISMMPAKRIKIVTISKRIKIVTISHQQPADTPMLEQEVEEPEYHHPAESSAWDDSTGQEGDKQNWTGLQDLPNEFLCHIFQFLSVLDLVQLIDTYQRFEGVVEAVLRRRNPILQEMTLTKSVGLNRFGLSVRETDAADIHSSNRLFHFKQIQVQVSYTDRFKGKSMQLPERRFDGDKAERFLARIFCTVLKCYDVSNANVKFITSEDSEVWKRCGISKWLEQYLVAQSSEDTKIRIRLLHLPSELLSLLNFCTPTYFEYSGYIKKLFEQEHESLIDNVECLDICARPQDVRNNGNYIENIDQLMTKIRIPSIRLKPEFNWTTESINAILMDHILKGGDKRVIICSTRPIRQRPNPRHPLAAYRSKLEWQELFRSFEEYTEDIRKQSKHSVFLDTYQQDVALYFR